MAKPPRTPTRPDPVPPVAPALPPGVEVRPLVPRGDPRGTLVEVFRVDWGLSFAPAQWNLVQSRPRALRGVHLHLDHEDLLFLAQGTMVLGLVDVRPAAAAAGTRCLVELSGDRPELVRIPVGVAHGFCFPAGGLLFYALSAEWTPEDELGCRFDSPDLGLARPVADPVLSPRDRAAGSWADLHREYHRRRAGGTGP